MDQNLDEAVSHITPAAPNKNLTWTAGFEGAGAGARHENLPWN